MLFEKGKIPEGAKPFKKGESGNPNGRPKLPDLSELIYEEVGEQGYREVITQLLKQAKKGNLKAIQEIMDRGYGKTIQKSELTGKDGVPLAAPAINVYNGGIPLANNEKDIPD